MQRTAFSVITGNLVVFILLTSWPAFQEIHHHWVFPILAAVFIVEWSIIPVSKPSAWFDPRFARPAILSILAFLLLMGIVRHWSILHCVGRCSLKLGGAAALSSVVFLAQTRQRDPLWNPARSQTAALACLLWAAWLLPFGLRVSRGRLDVAFLAVAAFLLSGWRIMALRACGLAIPLLILVRHTGAELPVILLDLGIVLAGISLINGISPPAGGGE
ncbi:MAG: hypothetical protein HY927_14470 [Elusimicrobia bacterium]|nr:hypothetical protein [Elusimicrobiota bacterium]